MADAESIDQMIYKIMEEGLGLQQQVASCVEIVEVKQTSIFNGEEGFLFFDGGAMCPGGASPELSQKPLPPDETGARPGAI